MKSRHTSSTLSRWTLEMAHLGCWKSSPTDMLEIRRGQGNRHFQMSSPFPRTLTRARLSNIASALLACRSELRRGACGTLSPDRANPAASHRSPRRLTALAGNRACGSRGRHANRHLLETLARLTCRNNRGGCQPRCRSPSRRWPNRCRRPRPRPCRRYRSRCR
jgi:hypothetical protein